MEIYNEVEISPLDLSHIRINLLKNYPLKKMEVGDYVNIQVQERGEEIIYKITKKDAKDYFFKSFEIKKYRFNRAAFDLKVKKHLLNSEIKIPISEYKTPQTK